MRARLKVKRTVGRFNAEVYRAVKIVRAPGDVRQPAHDLGLYTIHVKFRNVSRRGPLRRGDDRSFVKQVAQIAFGYFNDHCGALLPV